MPSGSYTGNEDYLAFRDRCVRRAMNSLDLFRYQMDGSNNGPRSDNETIPPRTYTTDPFRFGVYDFSDGPRPANSRATPPRTNGSGRLNPFQFEVDDFDDEPQSATSRAVPPRTNATGRVDRFRYEDDGFASRHTPAGRTYANSRAEFTAEVERAMLLDLHRRPHDIHSRPLHDNDRSLDLHSLALGPRSRLLAVAGRNNTRPGHQQAEVDDEGWQVPSGERNEWDADPVPAYSKVAPGEAPPPYEP